MKSTDETLSSRLHRLLTLPNILIALTLVCAVLSIYFRSVYREQPIMDERVYEYICEENDEGRFWKDESVCTEKVKTLSDAFRSQVNHYKKYNGRFLVHFIEQAFTGVWGIDAYNVINAFMFALLVVLVVCYSTDSCYRRNPLVWTFVLVSLVAFFPLTWHMWVSYNYAPNYLIPSVLLMAYLMLFNRLENKRFNALQLLLFSVMALLLGNAHEAFSIPLSGAMVVYGLLNIRRIFKNQTIYPIIALGIGTLITCLSPGNFARVGSVNSRGFIYPLMNDIDNMMHIVFMWIIVVALIVYALKYREKAKCFIKENYILAWLFVWAIILSTFANTGAYSFTAVELVSLILIVKLVVRLGWFKTGKVTMTVSALVLITLSFTQYQTVCYGKIQMKDYEDAIQEYITNSDGVFRKPLVDKPFYVRKFLMDWRHGNMVLTQSLQKEYNQFGKIARPLIEEEYDALADGSMFTAGNAVPGGSGFYFVSSGSGYWAQCDSVDTDSVDFMLNYRKVNFFTPGSKLCLGVKFALFPDSYPRKERVDSIEKVQTRWGDFYFIGKPPILQVDSITVKPICSNALQ